VSLTGICSPTNPSTVDRLTVVQKRRQGKGGGRGEAVTRRRQTVAATGSVILDRLTKVTLERKGKKKKKRDRELCTNPFSAIVPRTGKLFPEPLAQTNPRPRSLSSDPNPPSPPQSYVRRDKCGTSRTSTAGFPTELKISKSEVGKHEYHCAHSSTPHRT
jgi:hypothetical protein